MRAGVSTVEVLLIVRVEAQWAPIRSSLKAPPSRRARLGVDLALRGCAKEAFTLAVAATLSRCKGVGGHRSVCCKLQVGSGAIADVAGRSSLGVVNLDNNSSRSAATSHSGIVKARGLANVLLVTHLLDYQPNVLRGDIIGQVGPLLYCFGERVLERVFMEHRTNLTYKCQQRKLEVRMN